MRCCDPDELSKVPRIIDLSLDNRSTSPLYCVRVGISDEPDEPDEEVTSITLCSFPSLLAL